MPSFLLIIRDDGPPPQPAPEQPPEAMYQRFVAWADQLHREQRLRGIGRLEGEGGKTVRRRGGRLVVDGPFAEGKEAVLGYFLVEARDGDEAARVAQGCPGLDDGCAVEVRRMGDFPDPSRPGR